MSPKKFRSPEAEFVGCSIPRNQSLSPKDNRSVQLNSSQEVVLQVGPQSWAFGTSNQVFNERHFCGSKRKKWLRILTVIPVPEFWRQPVGKIFINRCPAGIILSRSEDRSSSFAVQMSLVICSECSNTTTGQRMSIRELSWWFLWSVYQLV